MSPAVGPRGRCRVFSFLWETVPPACFIALLIFALTGCAIAPMPDGSGYSVGVRMSGSGASAAELGMAAGKVMGAFGIPGAPAMGDLIGGTLALLGVGGGVYGLQARKVKQAADAAYDEAKRETVALFTPPPTGPKA